MTKKKTQNGKPGRNALPASERKQTIGVGLKPAEITLLDKQCVVESKRLGMSVDRSSIIRRAWLAYTALTSLVSEGLIDINVIEQIHNEIALKEEATTII
jgi:hypothetical protein